MNIIELIKRWEETGSDELAVRKHAVQLPLDDAARVEALAAMYPARSQTQIVTELLSAALDAVETALPYEQGSKVISRDELGDPIYEDVGPTPRFLELTKHYAALLRSENKNSS
ncbi:MAG: pilin assembly protein [Pseudomonadales bacterium]